jgi:putative ABC transport system permease protein
VPKSLIDEARRAGTLVENYEPDRFTIVGVAEDVRYGGLDDAAVPLVYVPFAQGLEGTTNMYLAVRAAGDAVALAAPIRHRIARVEPDQPVASVQTMEGRLAASVAQRRMQMQVLGGFALMAALLAAIGIYGVTSYAVAQRAREIGIRLALGARRGDVIALLLRQGLALVAAGVAVGLAGSFRITGVLQTMLFEVSPTDPAVLAAIVMLLTATALIATYVPARRAARVDPLVTLRAE